MPAPDLLRSTAPTRATGVVVLLHGGAKTGTQDLASSRSASRWRADRLRRVLEPRLVAAGLESYLLTYAVRGWNDGLAAEPSPVPDARWALEQVTAAHPGLPVVLLGHSMGARTAVRVADHPAVVGVVGLAPWFEPGDPVAALAGRHLLVGHGSRDKITSARATRAYVARARPVAASAEFVDMGRLGHYMLARPAAWNRFALRATLTVLERSGAPRRDPATECPGGAAG
ncbi:Alpha/beta hydrolase family protein [Nocardioides scoriae]|uniref:Alpha/beta hydrolase family protein n=1 Tax=Nocardioides scoriae TaxID=642780 RepID=A0A1H1Y6W4_9ACTN|nr:alpha/beta fold hydrolase [Nocardioides scoriae]SDT17122.1 Alpha/beta hydrolase family protein [Nocardioides scoriae]